MAYYQQPCDSYFVEAYDDRGRFHRDEMRDRDRQAKRQKQVDMAEQLSSIASQEHRNDHLRQMEIMEVERLVPLYFHSVS